MHAFKYLKFNVETVYLLLLTAIVQICFIRSPGTLDYHTFQDWMAKVREYGPITGYRVIEANYPPFTAFILWVTTKIADFTHLSDFDSLKWVVAIVTTSSVGLFYRLTSNLGSSLLLMAILSLSGVCLGYLDVLTAPFLILAMYHFDKSTLKAAAYFTIGCLIKWQMLIIAPFLLIYVIKKRILRLNILILPIATLVIVIALYKIGPLWAAFDWALHDQDVSGYALNAPWIYLGSKQAWGTGAGGVALAWYGAVDPGLAIRLFKAVFWIFYALCLYKATKAQEWTGTMLCAITAFFGYFYISPGVHENHLFTAAVIAILIYSTGNHRYLIFIPLAFAINLVVFYGLWGSRPPFPQNVLVDSTLCFAVFNGLYLLRLIAAIAPKQKPEEDKT